MSFCSATAFTRVNGFITKYYIPPDTTSVVVRVTGVSTVYMWNVLCVLCGELPPPARSRARVRKSINSESLRGSNKKISMAPAQG